MALTPEQVEANLAWMRRTMPRVAWTEADVDVFQRAYAAAVARPARRNRNRKIEVLRAIAAQKGDPDIRQVPRDDAGRPELCLHGVPTDACSYGCGKAGGSAGR